MPLAAVQVGAGWFAEEPNGLNLYFHDLLDALPDAGVACRGLVVGTARVEEETSGTCRVFAGPADSVRQRRKAARAAVARVWAALPPAEPKVLVTHFASYAYPLLKDHGERPWVAHFHGRHGDEAGCGRVAAWLNRRVERQVYRRADRVIASSTAFGDVLVREYGVDTAKIRVIPGGIDCPRFTDAAATRQAEARGQFGWPKDRPVVLCVRRLAQRMGLELLIDAVAAVRRRVPDVLCVVAGRGPLAEPLVGRIEAAGLANAITLVGFVPDEDLPLAYRAADVSVVPSETLEDSGTAAAESLAAGTPVVVTPVDGLPEVVRGLSPKLIATATTADALAAALTGALADRAALPSAEACRAYAAAAFDWPVIARRIAKVYAEVAGA